MEREERFEQALEEAKEAGVSMYGPQTAAEDRHLWAVRLRLRLLACLLHCRASPCAQADRVRSPCQDSLRPPHVLNAGMHGQ